MNDQLPPERKIRVISISAGWDREVPGYDEFMAAVGEAKSAGMLVVCSNIEEIHALKLYGLGRSPLADPDAFESYEPGSFWARGWLSLGYMRWRPKFIPRSPLNGSGRWRLKPDGRSN